MTPDSYNMPSPGRIRNFFMEPPELPSQLII